MKKLLLCMLVAGLTMPAMAQIAIGLWRSAGVSQSYDRQTQGSVYPMTQRHDDGFIGCTWTNDDNAPFSGSSTPNRGIGYAYSADDGQTWSTQENRVGGIPVYWPSYAQWGANGEAILARSADSYVHNGVQVLNGLVLMTRPNKGQGAWTITPVPYPAGTSPNDGYVMVWARMTTSGANHQYIHIMSPMTTPTAQPYQGYTTPVFYYRTQDGGSTWDINGKLLPEMLGEEWNKQSYYSDAISFAVQGNTVACSFICTGNHGYVLKSYNNGDTWESIKFFDSPVRRDATPTDYADTVYIPSQGCIALDNNGKIHVAFSVIMAKNNQTEGSCTYFLGWSTSFLTYWNEEMEPIDGDNDFVYYEIDQLIDNYFNWDMFDGDRLYVNSTYPKWPIIGFYTPLNDEHYFAIDFDIIRTWAAASYGIAGCFSFPQMTFDAQNRLRLAYLGLVDNGHKGNNRWLRHPYFTVSYDGGQSWTKTEYLVNFVGVIDREFAYLTLAGLGDDKMYLMAQTDEYPGTYIAGDHSATDNNYTFFTVEGVPPSPPPQPSCNSITDATATIEPDCKSATITWTPVDGAKEYEIRRNKTLLGRVTTPTYTDNFNFVNGTTYKWKIKTICSENASRVVSASVTAECEVCDPVTNAKAEIENCETATVTWTAVAGAKEYEISRDGNILGAVTTPPFTEIAEFEHGKSYTWKIKAICNLSESTEVLASATGDCVGISEFANTISIYPNPANTSVTINAKGFAKVEIYNPIGQLIESTTANTVVVSSYNTGIYFFKVYDGNGNSVTKRVMVARM
ncbi:MAG: T9SS type A sorting domain-containing protein [Bacteroidales bacterium]|nr:T9SS type A sorting domain-containing protein [Bacteroidales bacterium]